MNSPQTTHAAADTAKPATTARWEDYIDIFFSPAELFRRRASASLTHPIVTLCIVSVVIYILMLPVNASIMQQSAAGSAESRAFMQQWGGLFRLVGGLFVPISMLAITGFTALLLWLSCKLFGIALSLRQTMLIAAYAAFIYLLSSVASGIVALIQGGGVDPMRGVSFGLRRFADDGVSRPILALLGRVDLFVIWQAIICATGIRIIGGVSTARAAGAASLAWLLGAVPGMLMGLIPQPTTTTTAPPSA